MINIVAVVPSINGLPPAVFQTAASCGPYSPPGISWNNVSNCQDQVVPVFSFDWSGRVDSAVCDHNPHPLLLTVTSTLSTNEMVKCNGRWRLGSSFNMSVLVAVNHSLV